MRLVSDETCLKHIGEYISSLLCLPCNDHSSLWIQTWETTRYFHVHTGLMLKYKSFWWYAPSAVTQWSHRVSGDWCVLSLCLLLHSLVWLSVIIKAFSLTELNNRFMQAAQCLCNSTSSETANGSVVWHCAGSRQNCYNRLLIFAACI